MAKAPKPDLDDATIEIARRMLSAPPKPHGEMKVRKPKKTKRTANSRSKVPKGSSGS
jgi:hypothetical protein